MKEWMKKGTWAYHWESNLIISKHSLSFNNTIVSKRILNELCKLQQLKFQNKFILDDNSVIDFGNTYLPPRFNNTKAIQRFDAEDIIFSQGRIFHKLSHTVTLHFLLKSNCRQNTHFRHPNWYFWILFIIPMLMTQADTAVVGSL
jgi:hypothetical protein